MFSRASACTAMASTSTWSRIVKLINPKGSLFYSTMAMGLFGVSAFIMGGVALIFPRFMSKALNLDLSSSTANTLISMNSIAALNMGAYYLYMSYHRIIHFYKITIPFRVFLTFPVFSYLSFKCNSNSKILMIAIWELMGALSTYALLKYDQYLYTKIVHNPLITDIETMPFDYELKVKVQNGENEKQKYFDYFKNANNLLSNHPLMTQINYKDVTMEFDDFDESKNKQYLYLNVDDDIKNVNIKYKAILEFDQDKYKIIAYSFAWPSTYVINVYEFKQFDDGLYFVQRTLLQTLSILKSFAIKTAKAAHQQALNAMTKQIQTS